MKIKLKKTLKVAATLAVSLALFPIYLLGIPVALIVHKGEFAQRAGTAAVWPLRLMTLYQSSERTLGGSRNPRLLRASKRFNTVMDRWISL